MDAHESLDYYSLQYTFSFQEPWSKTKNKGCKSATFQMTGRWAPHQPLTPVAQLWQLNRPIHPLLPLGRRLFCTNPSTICTAYSSSFLGPRREPILKATRGQCTAGTLPWKSKAAAGKGGLLVVPPTLNHPPGPDTLLPVHCNSLRASIPNSEAPACLDSRESRASNNGRGERGKGKEASRNNNQDS